MTRTADLHAGDLSPDPFSERAEGRCTMDVHVLGCHLHVVSDDSRLMAVAAMAYAGLPAHRLLAEPPRIHLELRLSPEQRVAPGAEPPPVQMQSGAGFLCGVMDGGNYAVLHPAQLRALIVASPDMLAKPYHLRYELIEFAVFTLATRALGLVPLHGACVGHEGRAALVMGPSGAGKSTLALHSLLRGLAFIAEDAVFVHPASNMATGVSNYLHVTSDALRFVDDEHARAWIESAPVIRRRSGVEKYEADLRYAPGVLAAGPMAVACVVFASTQSADHPGRLVRPIPAHDIPSRLAAEQPYAASQPGWNAFVREVCRLGAYELRRGGHPDDSVKALRELLG